MQIKKFNFIKGYLYLPFILTVVPWKFQQSTVEMKKEKIILQNHSPEDLTTNEELKNLVNLLIIRVHHLEAAKIEQSVIIACD